MATNKKTHRLIEQFGADHLDRVAFVLDEEEKKLTQKQLKQRREIIVQLRHLGFFGKSPKSGLRGDRRRA